MTKPKPQKPKLHFHLGYEVGLDEAGRGCLAGPVFAAAVMLGPDFPTQTPLADSKLLSAKQRQELRQIIQDHALAWAIGSASAAEIDQINILQASFLAMHRALDQLKQQPQCLYVDGNRFKPYANLPHVCEIKGDGRFACIAAASILAKTYRDDYLLAQSQHYPQYDWAKNKGYPTVKHRQALLQHGLSPEHRRSFQCLPPSHLLFDSSPE